MLEVLAATNTLKGQPILALACDPWNGVWFNRQHLLSRIACENRVLYVTQPFHIREVLKLGYNTQAKSGLTQITDTLHTYIPPRWLPYNYRFPWINRVTSKLRIQKLQRTLDRLGLLEPILYIWHPSFADLVGRFNERLVVYHCYDEYSDFPGADRREIKAQEEYLLPRADIVFVASKSIYELKRPFNANIHVVKNAANYQLFASAQDPGTPIPDDLLVIPGPIVGCTTRVVASYLNISLLRQVFSRRRDWSLVVIGPEANHSQDERQEIEALKKLPNVYFLGSRKHHDLPAYLKGIDVCVMAYPDIDNVMHSESPLKMYEYLAAGKPIVSTPLPLISHLKEVISFAHGAAEWIDAIEKALQENDLERVEQRQAIARENTWDQRAAFVCNKLAEELSRRGSSQRTLQKR